MHTQTEEAIDILRCEELGSRCYFPPCIARLTALRDQLSRAMFQTWPLQSQRATELRWACLVIYDFHTNIGRQVRARGLSHIDNEMQNMIRIEQNLDPEKSLFGFTKLNKRGVLMKFTREREDAHGAVKQEVVVSETAYHTECVVCYDREREVVLYPCTHCCLCVQCKQSVFSCPICRAHIEQFRSLGEAQSQKLPFILSAHFPASQPHLTTLLDRLQRLT
jgi:hypothetical protein